MARKLKYNNQSHIKAYKACSKADKNKIRRRIDKYMKNPDITLNDLALEIGEILNHNYDRKKVASLIDALGLEPRSKEISHQSRVKSINKTLESKHEQYVRDVEKEVLSISTKDDVIKELKSKPYSYFDGKYGLSQYQVKALEKYWGIKRKNSVYTYKDMEVDLLSHGITKKQVEIMYLDNNCTQREVKNLFESTLNREVGFKRVYNLLQHWGLNKEESKIREIQGRKSREELQRNIDKLKKSGYTIESLAERYENDLSLTKRKIVEELNANLDEGDEEFTIRWLDRHIHPLLSKERASAASRVELEFTHAIRELLPENIEVVENSRKVIAPYELDIYIPELNIAIEFNGDYWHSDEFLLSTHGMTSDEYHDMKYNLCKDEGIELYYVWESDWYENEESVINRFKSIFSLLEDRETGKR